jgi:TIR domain
MTYDPPTAFLSYSRDDREFAFRLAEDLKTTGARVWLDQRNITPGERWDRAIEDALLNCTCLIVVLSPSSVRSVNVLDEVSFALEKEKQIVPVLYRDCAIPLRIRRVQYLDFRTDYTHGLTGLVAALRQSLEPGAPGSSTSPEQVNGTDQTLRRPVVRKGLRSRFSASVKIAIVLCGILALASAFYLASSRQRPTHKERVDEKQAVKPETSPSRAAEVVVTRSASPDLISGDWHSEVFSDPDPQQYYFRLKAVGARLFGTVRLVEPPGHPTGIVYGVGNGKIDSDKISFEYIGGWKHQDEQGNVHEVKESFFGLVSGDQIQFTYQREDSVPIQFTAKKVVGSASSGAK